MFMSDQLRVMEGDNQGVYWTYFVPMSTIVGLYHNYFVHINYLIDTF